MECLRYNDEDDKVNDQLIMQETQPHMILKSNGHDEAGVHHGGCL